MLRGLPTPVTFLLWAPLPHRAAPSPRSHPCRHVPPAAAVLGPLAVPPSHPNASTVAWSPRPHGEGPPPRVSYLPVRPPPPCNAIPPWTRSHPATPPPPPLLAVPPLPPTMPRSLRPHADGAADACPTVLCSQRDEDFNAQVTAGDNATSAKDGVPGGGSAALGEANTEAGVAGPPREVRRTSPQKCPSRNHTFRVTQGRGYLRYIHPAQGLRCDSVSRAVLSLMRACCISGGNSL